MLRQCALYGIALLAGCMATAAGAADMDIIEAPEIRLAGQSVAQGWYIRGDLGYGGWVRSGTPDYRVDALGGVLAKDDFDTARFSRPASYGAGIGYQFNNFLRGDMTADFANGKLYGGSEFASPCTGAPAGTTCGVTHKASYSAAHVLANGYVDLGTFAGITPYVGAGAGVTYMNWGTLKTDMACRNGTAGCGNATFSAPAVSGLNDWRFTYALMAGAAVDLTERVKLDIGYRFTDMDGGKAFGGTVNIPGIGQANTNVNDKGLQKHEIRAGIRVATW